MTDSAQSPTRFEPPASAVTQPFWDATRNKQFLLQWCTKCDAPVFYPREVCPSCYGQSLEWKPASGKGTVYAVSVQHRPANPMMASRVPYAVALIDLPEGARIMSNVIGIDADDVKVGMSVQLTWEALSDG